MNLSCIRSQGAHRTLSYREVDLHAAYREVQVLDSCQKGFTTLPVKVDSFIQKFSVVECSSLVIKNHVHSVTWAFHYIGWAFLYMYRLETADNSEDVVKFADLSGIAFP